MLMVRNGSGPSSNRWLLPSASSSVNHDNVPPGHVSVKGVSVEDLQRAVIERGKFPK
jgi:hypothetical protein